MKIFIKKTFKINDIKFKIFLKKKCLKKQLQIQFFLRSARILTKFSA